MGSLPIILAVEDDEDIQNIYKLVFEFKGFTVLQAFNGSEALDIVKTTPVRIILLDYLMPIMDGKTFLEELDVNAKGINVIVTSNISDTLVHHEMLDLGAREFLLKSDISPNKLVETVSKYL